MLMMMMVMMMMMVLRACFKEPFLRSGKEFVLNILVKYRNIRKKTVFWKPTWTAE